MNAPRKIIVVLWYAFSTLFPKIALAQDSVYAQTEDILSALNNDRDFSHAAIKFSNIGEYKKALEYYDLGRKWYRYNRSQVDSIAFGQLYHPVNAHDYILAQAQKARVIIFNESYFQARHRIFVGSYLHELSKMGFHYFGAESFYNIDEDELNQAYPLRNAGKYNAEPQMGHLLHLAIKEKYHFFAYGAHSDTGNKEQVQALNIKNFLDRHPNAKIIILCESGQVYKESFGTFIPMTARLVQLCGPDVLAIDQEVFNEHSRPKYEEAYYNFASPEGDVVYLDSLGKPFYMNGLVDIQVFHDRTKYIDTRPAWLFSNGNKPCYFAKKISKTLAFPCLAMAFRKGEDSQKAIPLDVIVIHSLVDDRPLALPKGKYIIEIKDIDGKKQLINLNN